MECKGVESVGGSEERVFEFLRIVKSKRYIEALYRQVESIVDGKLYRKLITIADLKTCSTGVIYKDRAHTADRYLYQRDAFSKAFRKALYALPRRCRERCGKEGFLAEVYASVTWFLDRGAPEGMFWGVIKDVEDFRDVVFVPVAYDFIIDLDLKNNPWLAEKNGLEKLKLLCDFMIEKLGLEPSILVSRGVQLRVTLLPLHLLQFNTIGIEKWPLIVKNKLPEIHKAIALKLAQEFYERHGIKVAIDTQVYDAARVTRLDLSIHSGIKVFSIPFRPYMLENLTWDRVRELQRNVRYVMAIAKKLKGTWGRIVEPEKYLRILGFFLALEEKDLRLNIEIPKPRKNVQGFYTSSSWRKVVDPILGEIEYNARLEGFGWIETLVKEGIPIPDGRLAFCWAILPVAIEGPKTRDGKIPSLITREEAVEWLKKCLEKYPDPEKSLEDYIEKLDYNLRYGEKYNIPTWRHLVEEKTENGERLSEVFLHIKYPTIYALHLHNHVRLSQEQVEKLEKLIKL